VVDRGGLAHLRHGEAASVAAAAENLVATVGRDTHGALQAHRARWNSFHARSWISVPTVSVEALWYAEMAKLGSAVRADGPPLGLQGPWSPDGRMPPWGGDLHHNVNVQLSYAPMAVTNHAELTESLVRYIETAMPQWRALARRVFDTDGVFVPSATDDEGRCRYEWALVNLAFSSGPWLAHVIHTHWRHTGDVDLLDRLLRPFLHAIAEPLLAQLVADDRGVLHLPYSYSPELMDATGAAWGPDGSCDLALLGWLLEALIDVDERAGADTTLWRDLAARLTPLPTDPDTGVLGGVLTGRSGGLRVRRDLALDRSHRHHSHLLAIHPLRRLTSFDPDPAVRSIASASLRTMVLSGPGEWVGFSVAWAASIAAHSGAPDIALGYLRDYAERWVGPSTFHLQASHHGEAATIWNELGGFVGNDALSLEAGFAFAAAVTELLVQDHGDVVRIFPALPQSWPSASFAGLRAAGGWELAALADAGHAVVVRVLAHRSGDLTLRYPGPAGVIQVQRTLVEGEELTIIEPGWTIDDLRPLR
jgi:alpha-L-fucosidase 2